MKTPEFSTAKYVSLWCRSLSWRPFKYAGCCAMALALASPAYAVTGDADGDGIEDGVEGFIPGLSSGFEIPVITSQWVQANQDNVPDWQTTAAAGRIEIWRTDFRDVPSYEGFQHAEINASENDTLFVELVTVPGSVLSWKIAHRGRDDTDTALVLAGAPGEAGTLLETMETGPDAWVVYSGSYTVPEGQTTTRFSFEAIDEGGTANFIDGLEITADSLDSDQDGTPDYLDTDSDDDGIPDAFETSSDTDGDGTPNYLDTDADGDGILDATEGNVDTDADGEADYLDTDSDADGITDAAEGAVDTDTDGKPDFQDTDSDADGIPDATEGDDDADSDGIPNFIDTDSDGDGVSDADEGGGDADGDGTPDFLTPAPTTPPDDTDGDGGTDTDGDDGTDGDTDGDGIPDLVEGENDSDGDGSPDSDDTDSDNDGISDQIEAGVDGTNPVDTDGDTIADYIDLDSDNDGIPDSEEGSDDLDGDGVANFRDLDVDNDGIADLLEARTNIGISVAFDGNQDGVIDGDAAAFGTNGLADGVETAVDFGTINYVIANGDSDDQPDYKDLDSDNDAIFDVTEMRLADTDLDGMVDEAVASFAVPADQDDDGIADFRDLDSDNDGLTDLVEAGVADTDSDGRIDNFTDENSDGVDDAFVATVLDDMDGDGLTNQLDLDSDQDSLPDLLESGGTDSDANGVVDDFSDENGDGLSDVLLVTPILANDSDGDGAPDHLDLDSNNDGTFDLVDAGNEDADNDGTVDSFVDPDNDGLTGENPVTPEPETTPPESEEGGLITGVSGGIGCVLVTGRVPFDPMLPGMLLLAGLGFAYRKKNPPE